MGEGLRVFFFNRPLYPAAITLRVPASLYNFLRPHLTQSPIQAISIAAPSSTPCFPHRLSTDWGPVRRALKCRRGAGKLEAMKRKWLLAVVCCASLAAQEPPRCGQSLRGTFWPEEANGSREARQHAPNCGELKICTRGLWRFRWEPVGIPYWRLAGGKAPAGCAEGLAGAKPERPAAEHTNGSGPSTD